MRLLRYQAANRPTSRLTGCERNVNPGDLGLPLPGTRPVAPGSDPPMTVRLLKLPLALLLLLCMVAGASAQTRRGDNSTWLPVWNNASGKLEAYLVLEPTETPQVGTRWRFGNNSLDATFGLEAGDSLALLCNRSEEHTSEL